MTDDAVASQVETDLRALHGLIRAGRGDDAEADELRERIQDALEQLPPEEQKRLNNLSGDLYEEYERGF